MKNYKELISGLNFKNFPVNEKNRKSGKLYIHGLEITITHPKNSIRKLITRKGEIQKIVKYPYGYINHTTAEDGEHVDVFIGPNPESQLSFIAEFLKPSGKLDETKVFLGVNNIHQVREIISESYSKNFYETRIGTIRPMIISELKKWLKEHRPYKEEKYKKSSSEKTVEKKPFYTVSYREGLSSLYDKFTNFFGLLGNEDEIPEEISGYIDQFLDKDYFAPGIPEKRNFGDYSKIKPGQKLSLVIQRHLADRAGPHYDIRLGNENLGLYSWAARNPLPNPGEKILAVRQPLHTYSYKDFSGIIPSGYGKGQVEKVMEIPVYVTKVTPNSIHISTAGQRPERYAFIQTNENNYLLINSTPREKLPYEKISYRSIRRNADIDEIYESIPNTAEIQPKIDGALTIIQIKDDDVDLFSHRISRKTGRPIFHTERFFIGTRPILGKDARKWKDTILLGEMYAVDRNGRILPPNELAAILNSGLEKSIEKMKEKGIRLKVAVFDTFMVKGKPVNFLNTDYSERKEKIRQILSSLGIEQFHMMPGWQKGEQARKKMWEIMKGEDYMTREGVVIHPPRGLPIKMKAFDEADVYVKEIFRGQGKYGESAGGIIYSLTPDGPAVGKVGTGLTDELRQMLFENPEEYKGRAIRIAYTEKLPSGAYRNPIFIAFHEDKN